MAENTDNSSVQTQSGFDFSALQHAVEVTLDGERLACVAIAWVAGM